MIELCPAENLKAIQHWWTWNTHNNTCSSTRSNSDENTAPLAALDVLTVLKFLLIQQQQQEDNKNNNNNSSNNNSNQELSSCFDRRQRRQSRNRKYRLAASSEERHLLRLPPTTSVTIRNESLNLLTLGALQSLLTHCPTLQELHLIHCCVETKAIHLQRALLRGLQDNRTLQSLSLVHLHLQQQKQKQQQQQQHCDDENDNDENTAITDDFLSEWSRLLLIPCKLPALHTLDISGNQALTDRALTSLLRPNRLKTIRCNDIPALTPAPLIHALLSNSSSSDDNNNERNNNNNDDQNTTLQHISMLSIDLLFSGWEDLADALQDNWNVQSLALGVHDFALFCCSSSSSSSSSSLPQEQQEQQLETVLWTRQHIQALERIQYYLRRNRIRCGSASSSASSSSCTFDDDNDNDNRWWQWILLHKQQQQQQRAEKEDDYQSLSICWDWLRQAPQSLIQPRR